MTKAAAAPANRFSSRRGDGAAIAWVRAHLDYAEDFCLIWPFSRDSHGYGHLGHNGQLRKAYRVMCELAHGPAPSPKHIASHSCGNGHKGCTNPRHLSWKTYSENQVERTTHGRRLPEHNRRKLTPQQKIEVQNLRGKKTIPEIAAMYGIKNGTVSYYHKKARLRAGVVG